MHRWLDVRDWPLAIWGQPVLILAAVALGAALSFAYSYAPLHRAKDWRIDYLEERLQARNAQVRELQTELEGARSALDGSPAEGEVDALRKRLEEAEGLAKNREQEIAALEKRAKKAESSRNSWRKKHAKLEAELETVQGAAAVPAAPAPVEPTSATPPASEPAPAAPADDAAELEFFAPGAGDAAR